jgi:ABC-type antimicrobial peptide transport system permease subunit
MRTLILKAALIAGAALIVAGCNRGEAPANNVSNELDANLTMSEPANDASAMESATNLAEPPAPAANASDSGSGSNTGGDTGGNNVESNTVGM